jgi:hypothetical protein
MPTQQDRPKEIGNTFQEIFLLQKGPNKKDSDLF